MIRRLILRFASAAALGALPFFTLAAQASPRTPDRWQLTLNDQSYIWNVRLVRLAADTLVVRSTDSLIATPIKDISSIQLLAETVLTVQDGHRSGIGALGDNNSPIVDLASLPLDARRERLQALVNYEATHN